MTVLIKARMYLATLVVIDDYRDAVQAGQKTGLIFEKLSQTRRKAARFQKICIKFGGRGFCFLIFGGFELRFSLTQSCAGGQPQYQIDCDTPKLHRSETLSGTFPAEGLRERAVKTPPNRKPSSSTGSILICRDALPAAGKG